MGEKKKEKKDKEKKKKKEEKEKATVRSAPDGSDNNEHQSLDFIEVNMLLVHLTAATSFHCSDLLTTKFILFSKRLQHTTQGCHSAQQRGKTKTKSAITQKML